MTELITDLAGVLSRREFPTVGVWNRLEGRPRTTDFARALRAEVRDPLWLLAGSGNSASSGAPTAAHR